MTTGRKPYFSSRKPLTSGQPSSEGEAFAVAGLVEELEGSFVTAGWPTPLNSPSRPMAATVPSLERFKKHRSHRLAAPQRRPAINGDGKAAALPKFFGRDTTKVFCESVTGVIQNGR